MAEPRDGGAMRKPWAWAVISVLFVTGCGERESASRHTSRHQQSLQVQLSAELDVERPPKLELLTNFFYQPITACNALRCFAFYAGSFYVYANRIDKTGAIIDRPPTVIGLGGSPAPLGGPPVAAAARGDEFLVIWGANGDRRATRLRGTDGQVIGDFTANLPQARDYYIESTGNTWLLGYGSGANYTVVVKSAATFETIGAPVTLPGYAVATPGAGQYLLAWGGNALRISETTGMPLDAAPISYSRYSDPGFPLGAYKDGIYLLAWATPDKVFASRIRASDGATLDPDDDFNQLSGAKLLCSGQYNPIPLSAARLDDSILVSWVEPGSPPSARAVRVDVTTGLRLSGSTASPELTLGTGSYFNKMYMFPDWGMAEFSGAFYPVTVQQQPLRISISDEVHPIALASMPSVSPNVASNGTGFLVVWETLDWVTRVGLIHGSRIDPSSGQYLDDPPLSLGRSTGAISIGPVTASNGTDYLVAWNGETGKMEGRIVFANGQLGPPLPPLVNVASVARPQLVWNKSYFYLTFVTEAQFQVGLAGVRLRADGTVLDANPLVLANTVGLPYYATVADTSPTADRRTFLTLFRDHDASRLKARRVRAESGSVIEPVTDVAGTGFLNAGSDGTRMLAILFDGQDYQGAFVDPLNGLLDSSGTTRMAGIPSGALMDVWYDGKSWLLTTSEPASGDHVAHYLRRFGSDLSPLDSAGALLASEYSGLMHYEDHGAASNGAGKSLFVYARVDPGRINTAVKARLITNDGLPTQGSGGTGGNSGSGGSSGSAGSVGAAGTDSGASGGVSGSTGSTDASSLDGAADATDASTGGSSGAGGTMASDAAGTSEGAVTGGAAGAADASTPDGSIGAAGAVGAAGFSGAGGVVDAGSGGAPTDARGTAGAPGGSTGRVDAAADGGSRRTPSSDDEGGCGCRYAVGQSSRRSAAASMTAGSTNTRASGLLLGGLGLLYLSRRARPSFRRSRPALSKDRQ